MASKKASISLCASGLGRQPHSGRYGFLLSNAVSISKSYGVVQLAYTAAFFV